MASIGVNWKDIWKPVWKAVWQQSAAVNGSITITGASATASAGTIGAVGDAAVTLTGASATSSAGTISAAGTSAGNVVKVHWLQVRDANDAVVRVHWLQVRDADAAVTLTGAAAVISAGDIHVTPGVAIRLTGASATASVGQITATGTATVTLVGAHCRASAGQLESPNSPYIFSGALKYDITTGRTVKILTDKICMSL
jgi:hypothetical protein